MALLSLTSAYHSSWLLSQVVSVLGMAREPTSHSSHLNLKVSGCYGTLYVWFWYDISAYCLCTSPDKRIVLELYLYPMCIDLLIVRHLYVSMNVCMFSLNVCLGHGDLSTVSLGLSLNSKQLYLPSLYLSAGENI